MKFKLNRGLVLFFLVLALVSSVKAVSVSHPASAVYNIPKEKMVKNAYRS